MLPRKIKNQIRNVARKIIKPLLEEQLEQLVTQAEKIHNNPHISRQIILIGRQFI